MSEARLARFFLRRLRHAAGAKALQRAVENGLLMRSELKLGALMVGVFDVAVEIVTLPLAVLRRRLGVASRAEERGATPAVSMRARLLVRRTSVASLGTAGKGNSTRNASSDVAMLPTLVSLMLTWFY